uniref:Uncharacterized protein n=1 Tax=Lepeophtheirus salmonis TaxID=72036 RepID=A0A0K2UGY1_LEPSM
MMDFGKSLLKAGHAVAGASKPVGDQDLLREALKLAKTKDVKRIDPKVLNYAATRIQSAYRGHVTRKNMKH